MLWIRGFDYSFFFPLPFSTLAFFANTPPSSPHTLDPPFIFFSLSFHVYIQNNNFPLTFPPFFESTKKNIYKSHYVTTHAHTHTHFNTHICVYTCWIKPFINLPYCSFFFSNGVVFFTPRTPQPEMEVEEKKKQKKNFFLVI